MSKIDFYMLKDTGTFFQILTHVKITMCMNPLVCLNNIYFLRKTSCYRISPINLELSTDWSRRYSALTWYDPWKWSHTSSMYRWSPCTFFSRISRTLIDGKCWGNWRWDSFFLWILLWCGWEPSKTFNVGIFIESL